MKRKETTTTKLVVDALAASDDFMNYAMLMRATGRSMNQISAACFSLYKYHAVDVIIQQGKGWWYGTPERDTRLWVKDEIAPESKPRKQRKAKAKVTYTLRGELK